jgi:hypothetical protein
MSNKYYTKCPNTTCKSMDVDNINPDVDGDLYIEHWHCSNCGCQWDAEFAFARSKITDKGEVP